MTRSIISNRILQSLVWSTGSVSGAEFFCVFIRSLTLELGVRLALATQIRENDPTKLQTLAFFKGKKLCSNFNYPMINTPCGEVIRTRKTVYFPDRIQNYYPAVASIISENVQSYLGIPILNNSGQPMGHICVLDDKQLTDVDYIKTIMELFLPRVSLEVDRLNQDKIKNDNIDELKLYLKGCKRKLRSGKHKITSKAYKNEETEQQFNSNEEPYHNILHASPVGLLITDLSGKVIEVNLAICHMHGYGYEQIIGRSAKTFLHVNNHGDLDELFQVVIAGGRFHIIGTDSRSDGSQIDVEIFGSPLQYRGQPSVLITILDLTDRKRMEKEQARLVSILEATPDLIGTSDKNGNIFYINSGGRKLIGISENEDVFCHNFSKFYPAWAQQRLIDESFPTAFREGLWVGEGAVLHTDGHEIPISQVVIAHRAKNGELEYLSTIIRDISASKRTEEILRKSEKKYRTLIETTHTGYVIVDISGKVVDANTRYVKLTGHENLKEILGRNVLEWTALYDVKRHIEKLKQCVAEGFLKNLELDYVHKNSPIKTIEINAAVIDTNEGQAIIGLCRDVTERKKEELKQKKITSLLQVLSGTQSQFIADTDPQSIFDQLLKNLLALTESGMGFIGEVLHKSNGTPYLKTRAKNRIDWNEQIWHLHKKRSPNGKNGYPLEALIAKVVTRKKWLIYNTPSVNLKHNGLANDYPELKAFMGIPFLQGNKVVGMVGIANRPGGYYEDLVEYLQPFIVACSNIVESFRADENRKYAQEQLKKSLYEKEVLLKEIHHRVKNNMQIISSMLRLQSSYINDKELLTIFQECQDRISSMALIHEMLYQSKDLAEVEFGDYIKNLVRTLVRAYSPNSNCQIIPTICVDQTHLNINTAIPLGLITNELISNVLKHAFRDGRQGTMEVKFNSISDSKFFLEVSDNGTGMEQVEWEMPKSMGLRLIKILTKQIDGKLEHHCQNGTKIKIIF